MIIEKYEGLSTIKNISKNEPSKLMVIISTVKKITTKKNNKPMAFVTVNDENSESIEGIIFPDTYEKYHELIEKNKIVVVSAQLETRNDKSSLIITEMEEVKYE